MWCSCLGSNELLQVSNAVLRAEVCGLRHYITLNINSRHWKLKCLVLACLSINVAKVTTFDTEDDWIIKQREVTLGKQQHLNAEELILCLEHIGPRTSTDEPNKRWLPGSCEKDTCTWLGPSCPDDRCKSPRSFSVPIVWWYKSQVSIFDRRANCRHCS